jgi:hypothetical protein
MSQPTLFAEGPRPRRRAQSGPRFTPCELARLLRLPEPTAEQEAIIAAPVQPLLVVAGAGSGKTETMASRVVWLVANGYFITAALLFIAAKIVSTALIARIFILVKPALMQIGWFAAAYDRFVPWKEANWTRTTIR